MSKLFDNIRADLAVFDLYLPSSKLKASRFIKTLVNPDFRVVFWFRVYSALYRSGWAALSNLIYFSTKRKFSCDLAPGANIGRGLRLVHAFNIVIGEDVSIGVGCKIFNGVSLGKKHPTSKRASMPVVADYVIMGTGAKILGDVQISSGLIVGANVVITVQNQVQRSKGIVYNSDPVYMSKLSEIVGEGN